MNGLTDKFSFPRFGRQSAAVDTRSWALCLALIYRHAVTLIPTPCDVRLAAPSTTPPSAGFIPNFHAWPVAIVAQHFAVLNLLLTRSGVDRSDHARNVEVARLASERASSVGKVIADDFGPHGCHRILIADFGRETFRRIVAFSQLIGAEAMFAPREG
jgi:hypothetical protein